MIPEDIYDATRAESKKLWNSACMFKCHITMNLKAAEQILDYAKTHTTSALLAEVRKSRSDVENAFMNWEQKMLKIQDLDGQCHSDTMEATYDEVYKVMDLLFKLINEAATVAERPITQAPPINESRPRFTPNSYMKPEKLSIEDPPHVMRAWIQDFSSYYSTSKMDVCSILSFFSTFHKEVT